MKDTITHVIIKYFQQQAQKEGYKILLKSIATCHNPADKPPNYIEAHKTICITKRRWYSLKSATNIDIYIIFYMPIYQPRFTKADSWNCQTIKIQQNQPETINNLPHTIIQLLINVPLIGGKT